MPSFKKIDNGENTTTKICNVSKLMCETKRSYLQNSIKAKLKACKKIITNEYFMNFGQFLLNTYFEHHHGLNSSIRNVDPISPDIIEQELYDRLEKEKPLNMNTFIQKPSKDSPQYYAGHLWNNRLDGFNKKKRDEYLKYAIYFTLHYMKQNDIQLISNLITEGCFRLFPKLKNIHSFSDIRKYLQEKLINKKCTFLLRRIIHKWFLIMPILEEIQKYIGWEFIITNKAFLLDVDTLYSILVNVTYNQK